MKHAVSRQHRAKIHAFGHSTLNKKEKLKLIWKFATFRRLLLLLIIMMIMIIKIMMHLNHYLHKCIQVTSVFYVVPGKELVVARKYFGLL